MTEQSTVFEQRIDELQAEVNRKATWFLWADSFLSFAGVGLALATTVLAVNEQANATVLATLGGLSTAAQSAERLARTKERSARLQTIAGKFKNLQIELAFGQFSEGSLSAKELRDIIDEYKRLNAEYATIKGNVKFTEMEHKSREVIPNVMETEESSTSSINAQGYSSPRSDESTPTSISASSGTNGSGTNLASHTNPSSERFENIEDSIDDIDRDRQRTAADLTGELTTRVLEDTSAIERNSPQSALLITQLSSKLGPSFPEEAEVMLEKLEATGRLEALHEELLSSNSANELRRKLSLPLQDE